MVFRRSFGNRLRPVNRIKHVFDQQGAATIGAPQTFDVVKAVDSPVLGNTTEVLTGSTVNGIFFKVEANATSSAALSNAYMMIMKNPGGNITFPNANVVGSDDNKKFVIHQEMVMFQQVTNSNPRTLFVGVVAIPRGYKRMAPNDTIQIQLFSPGVTLNFCIQAHYKEFR